MASIIYMASIHKKRGLFQKLNKEATSVLKIQQEEMDAQTQMLFCLMLLNNSFHAANYLDQGKRNTNKERKRLSGYDRGFKEETH